LSLLLTVGAREVVDSSVGGLSADVSVVHFVVGSVVLRPWITFVFLPDVMERTLVRFSTR
jgi:hypothetical protein